MEEIGPDDPRAHMFSASGFDKALPTLRLLAAGDGKARASLQVTQDVENLLGTLHGGAIATLIDNVGTIAIMSADNEGRPGVTTDLAISYMSAAPDGSTVIIEATTLKVGRTLAFVECALTSEAGKLMAKGTMTKFMGR